MLKGDVSNLVLSKTFRAVYFEDEGESEEKSFSLGRITGHPKLTDEIVADALTSLVNLQTKPIMRLEMNTKNHFADIEGKPGSETEQKDNK